MLRKIRALVGLFGIALAAAVMLRGAFWALGHNRGRPDVVAVGSKTSTDSVILAELMSQWLEQRAKVRVSRRFELGSTQICFEAVRTGEIDIYPEYNGTALTTILALPLVTDSSAASEAVRKTLAARYHLAWLESFGFNNSYVLAVPTRLVTRLGLRNISDLRDHEELVAGFDPEFLARPDGYPGLRKRYQLHFRWEPQSIEQGLIFQAAALGRVDVISANGADGRIVATGMTTLEDDLHFFPPYEPAPIVRESVLARRPEIRAALESLKGRVPVDSMRRMSLAVQSGRRSVADVVREFLKGMETDSSVLETP